MGFLILSYIDAVPKRKDTAMKKYCTSISKWRPKVSGTVNKISMTMPSASIEDRAKAGGEEFFTEIHSVPGGGVTSIDG